MPEAEIALMRYAYRVEGSTVTSVYAAAALAVSSSIVVKVPGLWFTMSRRNITYPVIDASPGSSHDKATRSWATSAEVRFCGAAGTGGCAPTDAAPSTPATTATTTTTAAGTDSAR